MSARQAFAISAFMSLLLGICASCLPDDPYKFAGDTQPQQLNDGWEIARPESVNISRASLDEVYSRFVSEDQYYNAKSLLIAKDGKLVFEAHVRDPRDRDRFTHVVSVTKSITSLVFGIVLSEGFIDSLDQTLYSIMPEKFPPDERKKTITLRHLLTMTSGLLIDNDDFSVELFVGKPADPIIYFLDKPLYALPGERFYYRDVDPHLVSYAIQRLTGKTEEQWARERLFSQLGITDYYWESDHTGITAGAIGLHLRARDMAKIGQMVLDHGRWDGIQIVDSTWITVSTQMQVLTDSPPPRAYQYGFYWWIIPDSDAFSAWGHGGSFIYVAPSRQMVIVMTSMPDAGDEVGTSLDEFEALIQPLLQ